MQIPDRTENNSLEELEIMKEPNLYFYESELISLGGQKKKPQKKNLRGMSEARQQPKAEDRRGAISWMMQV